MNLNHTAFACLEEEEREYLKKKNDPKLFKLINRVLDERIRQLDNLGESQLEHPNWPILRAYRDGRIRELNDLKLILKP